jgi:prolyl-tRNA synthetase
MKSLVLVADGKPVLVMLRGDHQLSETKFGAVAGDMEFRQAHPEEIRVWFGADAGSLGPIGVTNMQILADQALEGRRNMIAGANKNDYHLRHVTLGEDFEAELHDLRQVAPGDSCVRCGATLAVHKTIEIGHIFKLGYKYSDSMRLRVLNADGKEVTPIMGSYGIGIERILSAAIELYHDKDGMMLPPAIAPFDVVVTPANNSDEAQMSAARQIYESCLTLGLDALLDDRDERPGVKFKDADLIGVPFRITVGKKLGSGLVELVERKGKTTGDVAVADAANSVAARVLR